MFCTALTCGTEKLDKYYLKLDNTRAYVLAMCKFSFPFVLTTYIDRCLVLHLYYKLHYFDLKWGGEEEEREGHKAGNTKVINWVKYARTIVENAVSLSYNSVR